jgi:hypothetical protein
VGTECGAEASGGGGVSLGNKANGVSGVGGVSVISDAMGMGAGDTSSVLVGADTASFVPKTNSSIALPSGLRFLVRALSGVTAELGLEALL